MDNVYTTLEKVAINRGGLLVKNNWEIQCGKSQEQCDWAYNENAEH